MLNDHDTIVAPATPTGGAIAIVRISGSEAIAVAERLFRGRSPLSEAAGRTVHYGSIHDGERLVDEVLVTLFRAPHSYTGEDSVEISCHGSAYIVSEILRLALGAGARMASPGEFTLRAFLAGKLDLAQAEAVADLIASSSRAAHAMATNQMRGGYSEELEGLRDKLVHLTSLLELELDFSEEDVEFADRQALRRTMEQIGREIDRLRSSFSLGNAIKEGVAVAIVGAPNVGKSTLLNRLLNEERAMVSEIAGTTRDVIEERANIGGVLFRFLDTAGIRTTGDRLERMGIERTMESIRRAQVVIRLVDARHMDEAMPEFEVRPEQRVLTVVNKMDAAPEGFRVPEGALGISARQGDGIEALCEALRSTVDTEGLYHGDAVVSNSRHYEALTAARESLGHALAGMDEGLPADLLSEEIRPVIRHLGEITGQITTDEILGNIFSKFCVGK
ncbi:MAG TPA: tRNA uridine-5-carboxymethylaminomethyl(34) synthesis GTPase MnmE [Candidatus Alistipes stercorigallinarum]|nr:tRNA uridine-5-carboxymethylaminomethyl(34) synthesis GTPase MnmE [Candidatus Alistipes stercorigallinarum]